jgi:hypothetical protein
MDDLRGDVFAAHSCNDAATAVIAEVSEEDDEFVVGGREGGNIVPLVVGVCAREGLAAGDRLATVLGEDHLHALSVIWVDDGRNVEVVGSSKTVPAELGQHTGHVWSTLGNGIAVADPLVREGLVGGCEALDNEVGDLLEAFLGGANYGSFGAVLVDEVDNVLGCCHGCERGGCKNEGAEELHFEA